MIIEKIDSPISNLLAPQYKFCVSSEYEEHEQNREIHKKSKQRSPSFLK